MKDVNLYALSEYILLFESLSECSLNAAQVCDATSMQYRQALCALWSANSFLILTDSLMSVPKVFSMLGEGVEL